VGGTPVVAHDLMSREYTIKEAGYVFMYVSNENATLVDVYFDDVVMTHTKGNVVQYNEYYPFGLQTANSWTRENTTGNNFLGNGGTELNTTSNLYDLAYRNYDPILGRMNQIDPMATKYASLTPYNFSFNDPVTFTDPSGADPEYGITRYTYDDRVDHYRGQFYSGGSTSALRFHTGGRSGGITNWSYAPSFGQLVQMQSDALRLSLSVLAFVQKYRLEVWEQGRNYSANDGSVEFHHQYYFLKSISQQQQQQQQQQQTQGGGPCSTCPMPQDKGSDAFYTQLQRDATIEALVLLGFDRGQVSKDVTAANRYGATISNIKNYTSKLQGGYFDSHSFSNSAFQSGALSNSLYAVKIYESGNIGIVYSNLIDHIF